VLSSCGCTTLSLWERGLYTNKSSSEWLLFGIILFLDTNNNFAHSLCSLRYFVSLSSSRPFVMPHLQHFEHSKPQKKEE
jgi:hypothetical protein